ncbi:NUDIX hydrolase [soil metagenome]
MPWMSDDFRNETTAPALPVFSHFSSAKRLSCGIVILNPDRELLLCHVTGQNHWDLPKGGLDAGESTLAAALRETREETGLRLEAHTLRDLGRFTYTGKKDLHLYATLLPRFELGALHCESHFADRSSGKRLPEMDGYQWAAFPRVAAMCTPKMAAVLDGAIDLAGLLAELTALPRAVAHAASDFASAA